MASMKVAVRVRPLNQREINSACSVAVRVTENDIEVQNAEGEARRFTFDHCFHTLRDETSHESQDKFEYNPDEIVVEALRARTTITSSQVCYEIAGDVIAAVSCGYNAAVIAHGQTGSGKTYTLLGSGCQQMPAAQRFMVDYGVLHVISQKLLSLMECSNSVCQLEISVMEIYHDTVFDLLPAFQDIPGVPYTRTMLKVRDHPKRGVHVQGLSRRRVTNYTQLTDLVKLACSRRSSTDVTAMNGGAARSLSHVIFAIFFTQAKYDLGVPSEQTSQIYLADLADRMPIYTTRASVEERKKADGINRSLTNFNNVLSALADAASTGSIRYGTKSRRRSSVHVPYGDSSLTMLLKECIGDNSSTVFLAGVSPASCHYVETMSTLKMAAMASFITNRPVINEDTSVIRIKELWKENTALRTAIGSDSSSVERYRSFFPLKQFLEIKEKLKRNEEWIHILTSKWITRWLVAVKNEKHYYEIVSSWQAMEKSRNVSGTDSALGSDVEADRDSKSMSDDGNKHKIDRFLEHRKTEYLTDTSGEDCKNNRSGAARYRNEIVVVASDGNVKPSSGLSDGRNLLALEYQPELRLLQPQSEDQRQSRLEKDKAVARVSRIILRQQQLIQRRRADSQPNVVFEPSKCPPKVADDATNKSQSRDGDRVLRETNVPQFISPPGCVGHQRAKSVGLNIELESAQPVESSVAVSTVAESTPAVSFSSSVVKKLWNGHPAVSEDTTSGCCAEPHGDESVVADLSVVTATSVDVDPDGRKSTYKNSLAAVDTEESASLPLMTHLFGHVADRLGLVRSTVCQVLNDRYEYLTKLPEEFGAESTNRLSSHLDSLQPVIAYIELKLESGECDFAEQARYRNKLAHYRRLTTAIHKYIEINRLLSFVDQDLRRPDKVYTTLVDDLDRLDAVLSTFDRDHPLEKQSLYVLQIEVHVMRQRVLKEIDDAWNELINWQLPPYDDDDVDHGRRASQNADDASLVTLNLSAIDRRRAGDWSNIVCASSRLGRFDAEVSVFCERLLTRLLHSVTSSDDQGHQTRAPSNATAGPAAGRRVVVIKNNGGARTVSVVAEPASSTTSPTDANAPELVLEQLEQIFEFLDRALSGIKINVTPKSANCAERPASVSKTLPEGRTSARRDSEQAGGVIEESLIQKIGEVAIARILNCIYVDCLSRIVEKAAQTTDDEFSSLDRLAQLVERFEENLRRHLKVQAMPICGVSGEREGAPIVSLVGKMREACDRAGAARCGRLLTEAHALIVGDGDSTVDDHGASGRSRSISARWVLGERLPTYYADIEEFVTKCREATKTAGYRLPTCTISTSVRDLVCLIYNTLRQSIDATFQSAQLLHHAICQIIELYCDLEPFYHRDRLTTSSLHAALHHNNCMYLAHHLITVDKMFARSRYSSADKVVPDACRNDDETVLEGSVVNGSSRLRDLILTVRRLGNDYFTRHINLQKRQLCDMLSIAKGFSCIADDDGDDAQRAVMKVLNHFKSVAAAWRDILPMNAYCRSLGSLLNAVLRDVIASVVSVTEYSVDDCQCLQRVLSSIVDQITVVDKDVLFPHRLQSSADDDDAEQAVFPLPNGVVAGLESPKPKRKVVAPDGVQLQHHVDERCPVEVILERCVPAWPKFVELIRFFGLGLADVAQRWADGNGPIAMHMTGLEVARLVEAVFERTARRDTFVHQLRRNPSVHSTK